MVQFKYKVVIAEMVENTYPIDMANPAKSRPEASQRVRILFCLAIAAINAVLLFRVSNLLLQDPDNWWHVRVGLDILSSRTFPAIDTYSYTFAGAPWIAKEWLGQIFLALAYKAGDWNGVVLLVIATITLEIFLLAWYFSLSLKPIIAIGLAFLLGILVGPIYTARPVIFTLPIIIIWTAELFRAAEREKPPSFWLLPLICLWANIHATFTFGFIIAAFAGLHVLSRVRLSKPGLLGQWMLFGVLCPLVSLTNPYGVKAILATFTVAYGNEAVLYISEWKPFNASESVFLEVVLLAALFGVLFFRPRIGWAKLLFLFFNLHLLLTHGRFAYMFLLLVPLVLAQEIGQQFSWVSAKKWAQGPRDRLEQVAAGYFHTVSAAIMGVFVASTTVFLFTSQAEPALKTSAKGALGFVESQNIVGNVFNSYDFGGTLIFHGIKTYIDGRTDQLFLNGFMKRSVEMGSSGGKPLLEEQLASRNINWAILSTDDNRLPFFNELPKWQRVYADEYAVVMVKKD